MKTGYTIGCDYGTLSMRAVLVRLEDGAVLAENVYEYPDAVITDRLPGSDVELKGPGWALKTPMTGWMPCAPTFPRSFRKPA